jgi:hypothetical protein
VQLSFRDRDHVVIYLRAFADMLQEALTPDFAPPVASVA